MQPPCPLSNNYYTSAEHFHKSTTQLKLQVFMPVDAPMGVGEWQNIGTHGAEELDPKKLLVIEN